MKKTLVALCFLGLAGVSSVSAQQQQMSPQQMQQMMQQQMQMMGPMLDRMTRTQMNAQFDILAQPETADKLAAYTRNYYQALLKRGFSKEEALAITQHIGIPVIPMAGK